MFDYKVILGIIATLLALLSYIPYFRDIFMGKTKPHAFSWFVWAVLTAIAFAAQVVKNGGAGAWVTGFTALACFTISVLAVIKGKRDFPIVDWLSLGAAFIAMALWAYTNDPALSVILITLADALAFLPTFRKGFFFPNEETASTFFLSSIKFVFGILALNTFNISTVLYPASLVIMNGAFVVLLLARKNTLNR